MPKMNVMQIATIGVAMLGLNALLIVMRSGQLVVPSCTYCNDTPPLRALPPWYKTMATPCGTKPVFDGKNKSQFGEDEHLVSIFSEKMCGGTYVELGALTGKKFSNTHLFNKAMNWKGVMIEASPTSHEELEVNRPDEIANVHAGVCKEKGNLHWVDDAPRPVRGFVEFASEEYKNKWWTPQWIKDARPVKCMPLKDILNDKVGPFFWFDFFSLDVEGAELSVLQTLDFDRFAFGIILVEANELNPKTQLVVDIITEHGYKFLYRQHGSDWFQHKHFSSAYPAFSLSKSEEGATIVTAPKI